MILQEKGIEFAGSLGVEDKIKCGNGWSHFNPKTLEDITNREIPISSNLSENKCNSSEEENVAESSKSAQNRIKNKSKKNKKKPDIKLTNIKLCLPPNITSHLQPIDAGIIQSFKAKYKRKFCRYLIHQFDRGIDQEKNKLNVKEAIDQIAKSWNNVTEITIQNCWKKTGILPSNINEDDMDNITNDVDQESDFEEEIEYLLNLLEIDDICDYLQEFDSSIPTEDILTDEQIINLVHFEENEDDSDTSDEKIPIVLTQQAVNSLQTFIKYFEQHDDSAQYNTNDLRTFQKYLHLTKVKETNSRR
ncbi:tigger transposable element-derived protein 6-like [Rhizophagus irregularis DAOM 181602=DAOM 197198]|nr:tigger transposable element-derived protein 6-like [Rhizophagus irregularis DAOM 181602=DAOM 197198]